MYHLTLRVSIDEENYYQFAEIQKMLDGLESVLLGHNCVADATLKTWNPMNYAGKEPQEWADAMATRIADEAGYDDVDMDTLARVLGASPLLSLLIGSGIIEDEYFNEEVTND